MTQHPEEEYDKYAELCEHTQPGGGAQERVLCRICTPLRVKPYDKWDRIYGASDGSVWHVHPSSVSYSPATDWSYVHDDCDGAPDAGDDRHGHGKDYAACVAEIEELIEQGWWEEP